LPINDPQICLQTRKHQSPLAGIPNRDDRDTLFFSREMRFITNSEVLGPFNQGWNADGTATDCGPGGFGFNAGNFAQDFCLDGVWIEASGVPPETPFLAQSEAPFTPDCLGTELLSALPRAAQDG
jgi:hypothetical protein